ncbi:MAG: DUF2961 domain-containing protein [Planctomycetota bacterium]|nr:DUF2961 domain-containing protein [Planctomycetota bacterium]
MNRRRTTDATKILQSVLDPARYTVNGEISRGGMGIIIRAFDKELQRPVAVKIIRDKYTHSTGFARFLQEAQVMAHLHHPNIVQIHDIGQQSGYAYFVMELVEGADFDTLVHSGRASAPHWTFIAETLMKVADALAHCHSQGLLHRDLKPQNILVENKTNRPVLIDFGLVKADRSESGRQLQLTGDGQTVGTPAYMSLEQLQAHNLSSAADIWSLGATLFFAVTKRPPYLEVGPVAIYNAILKAPPPRLQSLRPDVPIWLDEICSRCLHRTADKRPSAEEVVAFFSKHISALGSESSDASATGFNSYSTVKPSTRLRRVTWIVLFALIGGLSTVGLLELGRRMSVADSGTKLEHDYVIRPLILFANGQDDKAKITKVPEGRVVKGLVKRRGHGPTRLLDIEIKEDSRWRRVLIDENNRFSAHIEGLHDPKELPLRIRLRSGEFIHYTVQFQNPRAREAVDFDSLLSSMTRLESLTRLPSPTYQAGRKTSYNAAEWPKREQNPLRHIDDFAHFVSKRQGGNVIEYILFDREGVGALSRLWLSDVFGTICVYIDDLDEPLLVSNLASLGKGELKPFVSPFVSKLGRAFTLNFPFPYKRFCRVSIRINTKLKEHKRLIRILRYSVDHKMYPVGTVVESIKKNDLSIKRNRILSVAKQLTRPPSFSAEVIQSHIIERSKSQELISIVNQDRAQTLTHFRIKIKKRRRQLLQDPLKLVLRVFCDEQQTVEVPLLAFFSALPNMAPYRTRGTSIDKDGWLHCYWPMPFKKTLRVELINLFDKSISVDVSYSKDSYFWTSQSLYFHALWSSNPAINTSKKTMYHVAKINDKGRYVGTLLNVLNPVASHWAYGNDYFQVDSQSIKELNPGPETDGYFGFRFAKKMKATDSKPRANDQYISSFQFCNSSSSNTNEGFFSFGRWHVLDDIPFRSRLSFAIEQSHISSRIKVAYSSIHLYYGQKLQGSIPKRLIQDELGFPTVADLVRFTAKKRREIIIEGESLFPKQKKGVYHRDTSVIFIDRGKDVSLGTRDDYYWSGEKELTWLARRKNAVLELPFKARPGRYEVKLRLTSWFKYGKHKLRINDGASKIVDLYTPIQSPMKEISLGEIQLSEKNTLTVQSVSMPRDVKKEYRLYGFGLDYIRLIPLD